MKLRSILIVLVAFLFVSNVSAQFPQLERIRERMNKSIAADEEKSRLANPELPRPKPAITNVDVRAILAGREYKTFAEASSQPTQRVADGGELWLYLKFKSRAGDYVLTERDPDDPKKLRYVLFIDIGPQSDPTALAQQTLLLSKDDLAATEFKINLAPGRFGRNASVPVFLSAASAVRPGLWSNEIRVFNFPIVPRGLESNLAVAPIALDLKGGNEQYKKMRADYDSIVLRGTADRSILPAAGSFFDPVLKAAVDAKLASLSIKPSRFFFAGDGWAESMGTTADSRRTRRVFAAYTYGAPPGCRYGIAEIVERFDFLNGKFASPEIRLENDIAMPCSKQSAPDVRSRPRAQSRNR